MSLRDLLPPVLWRWLQRRRRRAAARRWGFAQEQPPAFYDEMLALSDDLTAHYTQSRYYPVWTVVADRLRRAGARSVLDLGCGPGQVAALLRDAGLTEYLGVDFSPARVRQAQRVCPSARFVCEDVLAVPGDAEWVLALEFLEHVERDLEVLRRLRPGTRVLATVPNFAAAGHVRWFASADEVRERYGPLLRDLRVDEILAGPSGRRHFVLEGTRADAAEGAEITTVESA